MTNDQGQGTSDKGLLRVQRLTFHYPDGRPALSDVSFALAAGERAALVGPNGAGKSTLIKALLGEITVQHGRVQRGTRLEVAYYDQERAQLNLDESVMQNVSGRNDQVIVNGSKRVRSYDLQTGQVIWECGGQVLAAIPCPVTDDLAICLTGP